MYVEPTGKFSWADLGCVMAGVTTGLLTTPICGIAVSYSLFNHKENMENYAQINYELGKFENDEELKEYIENNTLSKYSTGDQEVETIFERDSVKITNSYLVTSKYDRQMISEYIRRTDKTERQASNLSAEWLGHNICYDLGLFRSSTQSVDLDYSKDHRINIVIATKILEVWGCQ